jgi:hypothetical protein
MKAETENGTENRDVTNYAILAGLSENYYKRLVVDMMGKCICYESCN